MASLYLIVFCLIFLINGTCRSHLMYLVLILSFAITPQIHLKFGILATHTLFSLFLACMAMRVINVFSAVLFCSKIQIFILCYFLCSMIFIIILIMKLDLSRMGSIADQYKQRGTIIMFCFYYVFLYLSHLGP